MQLDVELARAGARTRIAEPLGLELEDAAEGVLRIANANMVKAIRLITVERGFDPREFSLVAFGGAGAAARRRPRARAADARGDRPASSRRDERPGPALRRSARRLLLGVRAAPGRDRPRRGRAASTARWRSASSDSLVRQGVRAPDAIAVERAVDLRYIGQLHSVTVPLDGDQRGRLRRSDRPRFHDEHLRQYRYSHPDAPVETSTLCGWPRAGTRAKPDLCPHPATARPRERPWPSATRPVHFERARLGRDARRRPDSARPGRRGRRALRSSRSSTAPSCSRPARAARVDEVGNI